MRRDLGLGPEVIELLLPHRPPFLLIDRLRVYEPGRLEAYKLVSANEPVFAGHFPGWALWPGAYTLEGLAQTAGLLLALDALCAATDGGWATVRRELAAVSAACRSGSPVEQASVGRLRSARATGMLASADVRWRRPVFAGDILEYSASDVRPALGMFRVAVEARVDGERAADGELTLARQNAG